MTKVSEIMHEVADDLENFVVPAGAKFDMGEWGMHIGDHEPEEANYCGMAACAGGWLSTMPKWQARGFRSKWTPYGLEGVRKKLIPVNPYPDWHDMIVAVCGSVAGRELFEIFNQTHLSQEGVVSAIRAAAEEQS